MRELSEDLSRWEPVITWTADDNRKHHANYPEQQGKISFDQFMADRRNRPATEPPPAPSAA